MMMADDGLDTLQAFDAIYFGAVGWENVPDHISLWGLRLNITQNFDQWANIRPVKFLPGVQPPRCARPTTPNWTGSSCGRTARASTPASADVTSSGRGPGNEVALQTALFTEKGCERIMRFAFDLARTRTVKKVSSVTKSNAQQYGMVLWDEVFTRVAADYPDVATESVLVDAMSAKFILHPEDLSVVVASNLNADILSDLGSALAGSLGVAASANLNPERRFPSMFEPVHGSAPDIAGPGHQQPDRRDRQRRADARPLRPARARPAGSRPRSRPPPPSGALTRDIGGTSDTDAGHRGDRGRAADRADPGLIAFHRLARPGSAGSAGSGPSSRSVGHSRPPILHTRPHSHPR